MVGSHDTPKSLLDVFFIVSKTPAITLLAADAVHVKRLDDKIVHYFLGYYVYF